MREDKRADQVVMDDTDGDLQGTFYQKHKLAGMPKATHLPQRTTSRPPKECASSLAARIGEAAPPQGSPTISTAVPSPLGQWRQKPDP